MSEFDQSVQGGDPISTFRSDVEATVHKAKVGIRAPCWGSNCVTLYSGLLSRCLSLWGVKEVHSAMWDKPWCVDYATIRVRDMAVVWAIRTRFKGAVKWKRSVFAKGCP